MHDPSRLLQPSTVFRRHKAFRALCADLLLDFQKASRNTVDISGLTRAEGLQAASRRGVPLRYTGVVYVALSWYAKRTY